MFYTSEELRCACGAATCRGFLGANVAKDKEAAAKQYAEAEAAARREKAKAARAAREAR